jgi:ABC-type transport system involved in multi-copper enzyme maturation permease subunit
VKQLQLNPIMVKEFRSRMRGWRAFAILTGYLVFLALFSYGLYQLLLLVTRTGGVGMPLSPFMGRALYTAIANLSLFFVAFLTPALTAGAISSEHENLTLEMLLATPLAAHAILLGKLVSTASYIFILLFAAIPIASLVFTFGGVTPADLFQAGLIIMATGITFGIIGLFFSAWRKRTIQAIVLSYLVILALVAGTYAVFIFWGVMIQDMPPRYVLVLNPFSALASVFSSPGGSSSSVFGLFTLLAGVRPDMIGSELLASQRPLWHYTLAFDVGLGGVLYLLATRLIQPVRPWRIGWRSLAVGALIIVLYGSITGATFRQDIANFISPPPRTPTPTPVFGRVVMPANPVMMMEDATAEPLPTETPTPGPTGEAD